MNHKILFFIKTLSEGGAERVTSILASALSDLYGKIVYVCILNRSDQEYPISINVKKIYQNKNSKYKYFEMLYELSFINQSISTIDPDVIISLDSYRTNFFIELCNIRRNKCLVLSERNDPNRIPVKKIGRLLTRFSYMICDGVVFQTNEARDYFSSCIRDKSIVIANPMVLKDIEEFNGEWRSRRKAIVNCSRIVPQKNISLLIEAFSVIADEFPEYMLEIYGEGNLIEEMKQLTKKLGTEKRVIFKGFRRDALELIKNAALYVSSSDFEGISNSMLEAMMLGIPVICTDCPIGGARMMIEDGINGVLVPVGDKNRMVDAIRKVLLDERFAQKLSSNAIKIRRAYSVEKITEQWINYINQVMES